MEKGKRPVPRQRAGKQRMERGKVKRAEHVNFLALFTSNKMISLRRHPAIAKFLRNAIRSVLGYRFRMRSLWKRGGRPVNHFGETMDSFDQAESYFGWLAVELKNALARPTVSKVASRSRS